MERDYYQKIKHLFQSAVELGPAARTEYLNKECAGNGNLRLEVERLLDSEDSTFLEKPAVNRVASEIEAAESEPTRMLARENLGGRYGQYGIISKIGSGGMGEVYSAWDTLLNRKVALKLLTEQATRDKDQLRRFQQEARAVSALNHPFILTIFGFGRDDRGIHFIASEYVEGETLRDLIKREEAIPLDRVLNIAVQIAEALSAAHDAGIVHRDIKPENIMVREDGYVKVLDFGLAKLTEEQVNLVDPDSPTRLNIKTETGIVIGTASYMSPEQARGKEVDARSDIFSFGVLLYELLTGKAPFEGETVSDLLVAILEKDPAPVSRYSTEMPVELQHIISKALRKNKDERYQTMKSLAAALKTLRAELEFADKLEQTAQPEETVESEKAFETDERPHTTTETATVISRAGRKFKGPLIIGFAVLIISSIGFGYWYFATGNTRKIESIAVMPFVNESGNEDVEYLSDGMTETLIGSLMKIPKLSVKARSTVFYYKGKEKSPKELGEELNVEALLLGRIVQRGDDLKLSLELVDTKSLNAIWSETYDRNMSDLVSLQSEIAENVLQSLRLRLSVEEKEKVTITDTLDPEAYKAYLKGYHYWNLAPCPGDDCLEKSREFFKRATELDPNYAHAWSGLAGITAGLPGGGREFTPSARTAAEKAIGLDPKSGEPHMALAIVLHQIDWDLIGAEKELQIAIRLDPNSEAIRAQYGWLLANVGKLDEGLKEYRLAHQIAPLTLYTNNELSFFLFWARRYDESAKHLRQAKELDPEFSNYHNQLATVLAYQGRPTEALSECRKEREILLRKMEKTESDPRNAIPKEGLCHAEVYAHSGKTKEARKILTKLGENTDKEDYKKMRLRDPDLEVIWEAEIYALMGDKEKAFEELKKLSEIENEVETFYRVYADAALKFSPSLDSLRDDPRFQKIKFRRIVLEE